jgi:hypothetical protein
MGVQDKNARRSIKNSSWLLLRGDTVVLNAAEISRALNLARAFVTMERLPS